MENINRFKKIMDLKSIDKRKLIEKSVTHVIILNVVDAILTYVGLKFFGARELNPIMIWPINTFGLELTILFKIFFFTWLFVGVITVTREKKKAKLGWGSALTWVIVHFIYLFVVLSNVLWLIKAVIS